MCVFRAQSVCAPALGKLHIIAHHNYELHITPGIMSKYGTIVGDVMCVLQ